MSFSGEVEVALTDDLGAQVDIDVLDNQVYYCLNLHVYFVSNLYFHFKGWFFHSEIYGPKTGTISS